MKLPAFWITLLICLLPARGNPAVFVRGEVTGDGRVNLSDSIFLLLHLFAGGTPPACADSADVDDDGALDVSDAIFGLAYLFAGGPEPPSPGPLDPGYDSTPQDPFVCGDEPQETELGEEEIFARLTRSGWVRVEGGLFPVVTSYLLQKSGQFFYCEFSDHLQGAVHGRWQFEKTTASGGLITVDAEALVRFSLQSDGSLWLGGTRLEPGEHRQFPFFPGCDPPPRDCENCTRASLPAVDLPPLAAALAGTQWHKSNELDLYSRANTLEFLAPGRYRASFRSGECSFTSFWWLWKGEVVFEQLGCDFTIGNGQGAREVRSSLTLEGDLLRFENGDLYQRAGTDLSRGTLVLMADPSAAGNGPSASLVGTYERPFRRGSNRFRFLVKPLRPIQPAYGNLSFQRQALVRTRDGFSPVGEPAGLAQVTLPAVLPDPGFELEVDLAAPGEAGDYRYEVTLAGGFQIHPGSFIATLR